jgi:glycosyltransferase involved in cell wall biosynthesis
MLVEQAVRSRYFEAVLPLMRDRGVDVACVTLAPPGPLHEALNHRGVRTMALCWRSAPDYPAAVARLTRILRRQRPDLVHAHESIPAVIAGLASYLGPRRSIRLFHRHHTVMDGTAGAFSRMAGRLSTATIAVSDAARAAAIETDGVRSETILVAHNGVEPLRAVTAQEVAALRRAHAVGDGDRLLLAIARLRPEKGIDDLIRAGAQLQDDSVRLIVVGEGPDGARLRALASELRAAVDFVGHQEDVAPWLSAADVVAIPSHAESFGLVAIEAMAARRPIVASEVAGLAEIVESGHSGILVPPHDPDSLSAAIADLLGDPARSSAFADRGHERWQDAFTIEAMADRWLAAYRQCLEPS